MSASVLPCRLRYPRCPESRHRSRVRRRVRSARGPIRWHRQPSRAPSPSSATKRAHRRPGRPPRRRGRCGSTTGAPPLRSGAGFPGASGAGSPSGATLRRRPARSQPCAAGTANRRCYGVRRVLQGLTRQAAGRGQADPLTADDVAAIMATASIPRRTGRGMESEADAADRGATDKALVAVLFQGGLRRSEAAALRWGDVQDAADGRGIVVYVRRSKTDQDGTAADVRYLKNGCAAALRQLRDRLTVQRSGLRPDGTAQVLGGINGQSIARRLTAAAGAAGIEGRITGHSGRVGLAVELTRRGAPESRRRPRRAGGSRHGWSPTTRRPSQPSRAPSLPTCSRRQGRQAQRHRAPHPHRRSVDASGRPPSPPGARTAARRRAA